MLEIICWILLGYIGISLLIFVFQFIGLGNYKTDKSVVTMTFLMSFLWIFGIFFK